MNYGLFLLSLLHESSMASSGNIVRRKDFHFKVKIRLEKLSTIWSHRHLVDRVLIEVIRIMPYTYFLSTFYNHIHKLHSYLKVVPLLYLQNFDFGKNLGQMHICGSFFPEGG